MRQASVCTNRKFVPGSCKLTEAHEKVCDENERNKKNDGRFKNNFIERKEFEKHHTKVEMQSLNLIKPRPMKRKLRKQLILQVIT